jgi:dTDP-glucose 4,6-dehydratase
VTTPTWIVTGGAGFIGSNFVRLARAAGWARIVTLDKLTYAGRLESLADLDGDPEHVFVRGDIGDKELVRGLLDTHRPSAIVNFAAESHVDRSILGPAVFVETNVVGTHELLRQSLDHWRLQSPAQQRAFRFLHVSTDEVYGALGADEPPFREDRAYQPNSPYAASKAAADHLVRAYHRTFGLPTLTTNCSNNYGPRQHPEKLIPLMTLNAAAGKPLPLYGDGRQVRDWLFVEDHCRAIAAVLDRGRVGETYNVGGEVERTNAEVVAAICGILDALRPERAPHARLVAHVTDRPGHDRRYAIDAGKLAAEIGFRPATRFEDGLRRTVEWFLANDAWVASATQRGYSEWVQANYANRKAAR